jgi:glycosyltransferase involved in cell wall biosynthesis
VALVLAYNESACIAEVIAELRQAAPQVDLVVIDDGSTDRTAEAARAAGATVLRHPLNLGVAAAEATGLMYAVRRGYTRAVRLDGDGQHDPAFVGPLFDALDAGADVVVGSRYLDLRSFESSSLRRAGGRYLAWLLSALCKMRITDPTSGYRAFSLAAIRSFAASHPHDYPEPESLLLARRRGLEVVEVSVRMRPRKTGRSSITPGRSLYYMVKVSLALTLESLRPQERQT